jgi:peptide-methionine (R)-S-oxide reductase
MKKGRETGPGKQMLFAANSNVRFPRRSLLGLPVVAVFVAAVYPRQRRLPDPAQSGNGPEVRLTLFTNDRNHKQVVSLRSLMLEDSDWRRDLTGDEFAITRRKGTEFAFANRYWDCHEQGLYRCVCCGTALFRSEQKFDSGTGWPSFSAPCAQTNIYTEADSSYSMQRTEVLCRKCGAHLGHVFDDGPPPSGLRYCLNSAALRLVTYS